MPYERTRNLDPEFVKLVVPLLPPRNTDSDGPIDVGKSRAGMNAMTAAKERALNGPWKHLLDEISIQNIRIPMRDGHQAELRIIKPKKATDSLPVLYSLHGGGFIGGNNDTEELINRQLAFECQVAVFSLDYRLTPEHEVTTTIYEDAEDGGKWVVEHASEHGGDLEKGFFVGGTSVGAQLSAMLAYRASSLNLPIKGMVLRQGAFVYGDHFNKDEWKPRLKSMEENADSPLLNANDCNRLNKIINIPADLGRDPWYFPIFGSREQLSKLPRAYIVGAGCDPVVDQVFLFKDLLDDAGVETRMRVYDAGHASRLPRFPFFTPSVGGNEGYSSGIFMAHSFCQSLSSLVNQNFVEATHSFAAISPPFNLPGD